MSKRYSIQARTLGSDDFVEVAQVDTHPEAIARALRRSSKRRTFGYEKIVIVDQQQETERLR
jgi:hypothetical protein